MRAQSRRNLWVHRNIHSIATEGKSLSLVCDSSLGYSQVIVRNVAPSHRAALAPTRRLVVASVAPMPLLHRKQHLAAGYSCSAQGPQLDEPNEAFCPPVDSTPRSSPMTSKQQEAPVNSSLISPRPATKVTCCLQQLGLVI